MQIKLNNSKVYLDGDVKTLSDLVKLVKNQCLDKDSVVTQISIDGKERDISRSDLEVHKTSMVEVISELPQALAAKSINNLKEHIYHTLPMLEKASDKFRTEGEEEANKYYSECLGALQLFSEVLDGVGQMLSLDYSKIKTDPGNIDNEMAETQKLFEAMHGAQKQKDWVLLADIIEYELVPVMKSWDGFFSSILDYINNPGKKLL